MSLAALQDNSGGDTRLLESNYLVSLWPVWRRLRVPQLTSVNHETEMFAVSLDSRRPGKSGNSIVAMCFTTVRVSDLHG